MNNIYDFERLKKNMTSKKVSSGRIGTVAAAVEWGVRTAEFIDALIESDLLTGDSRLELTKKGAAIGGQKITSSFGHRFEWPKDVHKHLKKGVITRNGTECLPANSKATQSFFK